MNFNYLEVFEKNYKQSHELSFNYFHSGKNLKAQYKVQYNETMYIF